MLVVNFLMASFNWKVAYHFGILEMSGDFGKQLVFYFAGLFKTGPFILFTNLFFLYQLLLIFPEIRICVNEKWPLIPAT